MAAATRAMSVKMSSSAIGDRATIRGAAPVQPAQSALDVVERHRADLALGLGHDHVGARGEQRVGIDAVDRQRLFQQGADLAMDGRAAAARIELGGGDRRQARHTSGLVAFMAARHELIGGAEGGNDLRGAGQEGGDSESGHRRR